MDDALPKTSQMPGALEVILAGVRFTALLVTIEPVARAVQTPIGATQKEAT